MDALPHIFLFLPVSIPFLIIRIPFKKGHFDLSAKAGISYFLGKSGNFNGIYPDFIEIISIKNPLISRN
jgi:hypothetical protein